MEEMKGFPNPEGEPEEECKDSNVALIISIIVIAIVAVLVAAPLALISVLK